MQWCGEELVLYICRGISCSYLRWSVAENAGIYEPEKQITTHKALEHPYFNNVIM